MGGMFVDMTFVTSEATLVRVLAVNIHKKHHVKCYFSSLFVNLKRFESDNQWKYSWDKRNCTQTLQRLLDSQFVNL